MDNQTPPTLPIQSPVGVLVYNIVGDDGKTDKQRNLEKTHKIPIGSLVEVKINEWYGDGACEKIHARLWVVSHDRDCDGTPMYSLCSRPLFNMNTRNEHIFYRGTDNAVGQEVLLNNSISVNIIHNVRSGYVEEDLTVVEVTDDVVKGRDCLQWNKDEK